MFNYFRSNKTPQDNKEDKNEDNESIEPVTIGIDFGTRNCCVAIHYNQKTRIIPNDLGDKLTPTYISFTHNGRLFGQQAKNQSIRNPNNTVFDIHRLIGKKYDNMLLQNQMRYWPFKIIPDNDNDILIQLNYRGSITQFYPQQLLAMILTHLRNYAQLWLTQNFNSKLFIKHCIISIPTYFDYGQRKCIMDSANIAGFESFKLLDQATLCGINYIICSNNNKNVQEMKDNNGNDDDEERLILVYNLGASSLNLSLISYNNDIIEVKGIEGDMNLGGNNIDYELIQFLRAEFERLYHLKCNESQRSLMKLYKEIEKLKKSLSLSNNHFIEIYDLFENTDFSMNLNRKEFEDKIIDKKYKQRLIDPIEQILNEYNSNNNNNKNKHNDLNYVILTGSCSRIPYIQQLITSYFNENGKDIKVIYKSINPDEYTVNGAAIYPFLSSDFNIEFININPITLSVGNIIETEGNNDGNEEGILCNSIGDELIAGSVINIINKNDTIPCKKNERFTTFKYNQTKISIPIYEGECEFSDDNVLLGILYLDGLEINKNRGYHKIEIEFDLNEDNKLNVNVKDLRIPKNYVTMEIGNYWKINYDQQKIDDWVAIQASLEMDDKEKEINEKSKSDLQIFINNYCNKFDDFIKFMNKEKESVMEWIDNNPNINNKQCMEKQKVFKKLLNDKLKQIINPDDL